MKTTAITIVASILVILSYANAQQIIVDRPMNCDSACIVPQSSMQTPMPKANTFVAPQNMLSPTPRPQCGPSAGSILPSAPSTFLCAVGTPSAVVTAANSSDPGDFTYQWTCSNSLGSQFCSALPREIGACGADNGQILTGNPTNQCSSGQAYGFNFTGNQYMWGCAGNYGSPAMCSATYQPPRNCLYDLSGMTDWTNGSYYYVFYTPNVGLLAAYGKTGSNFAVMYEANPFTYADAKRIVNSYGYDIGNYVESYGNLQAYQICK